MKLYLTTSQLYRFHMVPPECVMSLSSWSQVIGDPLGWGFVVRGRAPCYVQAVDPGSPAAAAGVKVRYVIVTHDTQIENDIDRNITYVPDVIVCRCGSLCARCTDSVFSTWTTGPWPGWWWLDLPLLYWKWWNHWNDNNLSSSHFLLTSSGF